MRNASLPLLTLTRGAGLLLAVAAFLPIPSPAGEWQDLFGPPPDPDANWTKHFRIGALVGFNFKADFTIGGTFSVSGNPGPTGVRAANHEYDDGFVRVDASGNDQDSTWYWGYENASQVIGQRLYFHSASSFQASESSSANSGGEVGFDSAYGGRIGRLWGGTAGWECGFGLMPINIKSTQSTGASVVQTVHWYDLSALNSVPTAPYEGSYEGPSTKLNDLATAEPAGPAVPGTLTGSQTLDVMLYNFRLGPTLQWELHRRIAVAVSAGAAFGIVSGDLKYNQTLQFGGTTANLSGETGDTEFVYGGYVAGTFLFHAVKNGDVYLGFQYMPMSSATFSGDGREGKLDLTGGLYFSAGINWPF